MLKRRRDLILVIALLMAGLSVLLYPFISNMIYQHKANSAMQRYESTVQGSDEEQYQEEISLAENYNRELLNETVPESFFEREGIHNDKRYESLLDPTKNGMMGSIEIPSIGVQLPIFHYTTKETLLEGAGHLFGSSLPVGGRNTHAVITAHRGLPSAKLFTDLDLIEKRDIFYIHVFDRNMAYEVDQIKTVEPEDTGSLGIVKGKDYVTLITCTPYGKNTHRLLVRGHRIPYEQSDQPQHHRIPLLHMLSVLAGVVSAVLITLLWRRRKRKH